MGEFAMGTWRRARAGVDKVERWEKVLEGRRRWERVLEGRRRGACKGGMRNRERCCWALDRAVRGGKLNRRRAKK